MRVDTIYGGRIGLLVFLHGWARAAAIELKLMNATQHMRELLELTNLDSLLEEKMLTHGVEQPCRTTALVNKCDYTIKVRLHDHLSYCAFPEQLRST